MKKRFQIGDLAKVVVIVYDHFQYLNQICEIIEVYSEKDYYRIQFRDGKRFFAYDYQLQPLNPPSEPESFIRRKQNELSH